jgi:hypothetical protein
VRKVNDDVDVDDDDDDDNTNNNSYTNQLYYFSDFCE